MILSETVFDGIHKFSVLGAGGFYIGNDFLEWSFLHTSSLGVCSRMLVCLLRSALQNATFFALAQ